MRDLDYYIPAGALFLALLSKAPALLRRRNPMVTAMAGLIFMACVGYVFAAPPTIRALNRATGVANVSAPLVYVILSAFNASCIALLVYWREGTGRSARERARRWLAACAVVTCLIPLLFALGDAPVERLRDFDTYYANTPFIREMIVVYLGWHILVGAVLPFLCWRWSREVGGWVKAGLRTLVAGFVLNVVFGMTKGTAVVARWAGGDLDPLSSYIAPPAASVGALLTTLGFLLPQGERVAAHWQTWRLYRRLGPLHRDLGPLAPAAGSPRLPLLSLGARLSNRECDVYDRLFALAPYCDPYVLAAARAEARQAGEGPETASAFAAAAMIADAIEASRDRAERTDRAERPDRPERTGRPDLLDESAQAAGLEALGPVIATGAEGMARVAAHYSALSRRTTREPARVRTQQPSAAPPSTPEPLLRKTHP
ncbi:MAB_1171c family putative transporter [Streptomyces sp. NPDC056485]|uniref:MAB_1171c family putative transporter n=1 Tax=Streptomyces sp. NPDC056485 TaxID=3345834 RepID=UPI00369BA648